MAETVLRSSGVVTTVLGTINQLQSFTNKNYNMPFNTTLNSKYGVLADSAYRTLAFCPTLRYFGIGVRGYKNIDLEQAALPYPGDARLMDLYHPIPIRCVPIDEDLTLTERSHYRLRVEQEIDGTTYALYYLKLIDFSGDLQVIKKDADGTESPYALSPEEWLNPTPPDMNQIGGNINTNVNRILVRLSGICEVTHDEIENTVNVIYNGDTNYARISELGYYTGYDVALKEDGTEYTDDELTPSVGGAPIQPHHYEAAFVQLAKYHAFKGSDLNTSGSYIRANVCLGSERCIYGVTY